MRRLLPLLAVAAAAGCTGDGETTTVTVTTTAITEEATLPPRLPFPLPADGQLPVDDFNAYTEHIDEPWEHDLESIANAFVEAGAVDASERSFQSTTSGDGDSATMSLTLGLFDDSVRAVRYVFELGRRADGAWNVESATWAQRCHEGRGHRGFSPTPCV